MTLAVTCLVVTLNVAVEAPAGTRTVAGTIASALFEESPIETPPGGAFPVRLTVPTAVAPPATVDGNTVRPISDAGLMVIVTVFITVPAVAEMIAVPIACTADVVTLNVAELAPLGTTTVAGTCAIAAFDDRLTVNPLAGAAPPKVTVPVELDPPPTIVGDSVKPDKTGGVRFRVAVLVEPPAVAVSVALELAPTGKVLTVKVA